MRKWTSIIALYWLGAAAAVNPTIDLTGDAVEVRDGRTEIRLDGKGEATTRTVARLTDLAIFEPLTAVVGQLRTESVGTGYLELWVIFEDGGRYFSRAQATEGPGRVLDGSQPLRSFILPFNAEGASSPIVAIELNVHLTDHGSVWLSGVSLQTGASWAEIQVAPVTERWWSARAGGWLGAGIGTSLGLLVTIMVLLAARGRARGVVLALATVLLITGVGFAATAAVAWSLQQPYGVWYPLLLGGVLAGMAGGFGRPLLSRQFTRHELRQMAAHDRGA